MAAVVATGAHREQRSDDGHRVHRVVRTDERLAGQTIRAVDPDGCGAAEPPGAGRSRPAAPVGPGHPAGTAAPGRSSAADPSPTPRGAGAPCAARPGALVPRPWGPGSVPGPTRQPGCAGGGGCRPGADPARGRGPHRTPATAHRPATASDRPPSCPTSAGYPAAGGAASSYLGKQPVQGRAPRHRAGVRAWSSSWNAPLKHPVIPAIKTSGSNFAVPALHSGRGEAVGEAAGVVVELADRDPIPVGLPAPMWRRGPQGRPFLRPPAAGRGWP